MKKLHHSGFITQIFISIFFISFSSLAQTSSERVNSSTTSSDATWSKKKIAKWYKKGEWLNGLKLKPHGTINQHEFSRQYHTQKGKIWWDKAFEWLKTQDLNNLKPGSYRIDSGYVTASVSEVAARDADLVNWEAHRNTNDLQYIITGKAQVGILPISDTISNTNSKMKTPYTVRSDTEAFDVVKGPYYTAEPGTFFIFSPKEIHRPHFKLEGYDIITRILIKVRVP